MRPQPKLYARITIHGLDDLVSLSDVSRIRIAEATDENAVERCVIITYTDGTQHVFDTKDLCGAQWYDNCTDLVQQLSAAVALHGGAVIVPLAVADP